MSVSVSSNKDRQEGNGLTTDFDFDFKIFQETDIMVFLIDKSTAPETPSEALTITTHYSVTIDDDGEGFTVSMVTAPTSDEDILVKRSLPQTQPRSFPIANKFPSVTIEEIADKATMLVIDLQEQVDRSLKFSETSQFEDFELPDPEADKLLGWNSDETALENKSADDVLEGVSALVRADIADGQAVAANITGVTIDSSLNTSALCLCEIRRGTSTRYSALLLLVYSGTTWSPFEIASSGEHGLTFSMSTSSGVGQLKYTSDSQGVGEFKIKRMNLNA